MGSFWRIWEHRLWEASHWVELRSSRLKEIADVTSQTYRELVLTRNDVQGLRDMFAAMSVFVKASSAVPPGATSKWHHAIDEEFAPFAT